MLNNYFRWYNFEYSVESDCECCGIFRNVWIYEWCDVKYECNIYWGEGYG